MAANYYARAKALSEQNLISLHRQQGLPVVIFRPGIVIGQGGSPFHWGIGMWSWNAVCQVWGKGHNPLPFVLVEDVAQALVSALDIPGIEGESFNLVADSRLSALDYLHALEENTGGEFQKIPTPPWKFYVVDVMKWMVKRAIRHSDRRRPSYRDWETRTQRGSLRLFQGQKTPELEPDERSDRDRADGNPTTRPGTTRLQSPARAVGAIGGYPTASDVVSIDQRCMVDVVQTGDLPITPQHSALLQPASILAESPNGDLVDSSEIVIRPQSGWIGINWKRWSRIAICDFIWHGDIVVRYKQTVLGPAWAILQPLILMVVFTFVFGRVAQFRPKGFDYPVFVFAGLIPWTLFSQGTSVSLSLVDQRTS